MSAAGWIRGAAPRGTDDPQPDHAGLGQKLAATRKGHDQLFAEAVHKFQGGAKWWPDAEFEAEHIRPQQAARYEDDAWQQAIAEWLSTAQRTVTILQVAREALHIETPKLGTADQRRIAAAMEKISAR